jgi:hypothetical protein
MQPYEASDFDAGLLRGLAETGFVEGRNLGIDQRFAKVTLNDCRRWLAIWYSEIRR